MFVHAPLKYNTCTIAIYVSLNFFKNECLRMQEAYNVCQSYNKGLT